MGVYLFIPWFKLDPWPIPTPYLVAAILLGCGLAALKPAWRGQAFTTALLAAGAGGLAWAKGFEEVPIQPFGILVALGVLSGSRLSEWYAKRQGIDPMHMADFITHVVVVGFLCAYLLNGLFYETDKLLAVLADPRRLFSEWLGLSSYGGFIGAMLGIWIWKKRRKCDAMPLADAMGFGFPLGWLFGRTGCFVVHDHPGAETDFFMAVDNFYGHGVPRHDMGFYEILVAAFILGVFFIILKTVPREKRPMGLWCALQPMIYAPIRFGLDYLRATDVAGADVRAAGLTPAQYASIGMFVFSVLLMAYVLKHPKWVIPDYIALEKRPAADPDADAEDEEAAAKSASTTRRKRKK